MTLYDLCYDFRTYYYIVVPYKTGRLCWTGMGDVYNPIGSDSLGFDLFRRENIQYGWMLNEFNTMSTNLGGRVTRYNNKHYQWFDKAVTSWVNNYANLLGGSVI